MSLTTIEKELKLTDRFENAFPDKLIPTNSNIDKGKTRVGMTHEEFHAKRSSFLVIPSVPIIEDKCDEYPYLYTLQVKEGVTPEMIGDFLFNDTPLQYIEAGNPYKKIVCTPESFPKVIAAATNKNKLQWLRDTFFLFLDESHCYATDAFREQILNPFPEFWNFKSRAIGSATPFKFSDLRFQELQHYKFTYKEKFGRIKLIVNDNVQAALNYYLSRPELFPGNFHIFFNSVTECGQAVMASGITDVNIYCRDEEKNMINLDEAKVYFKHRPIEGEYKKFNFYSVRYNEGWGLKDDSNATLILVTDIAVPHSLIGIPYKGFQALGRSNTKPYQLLHITNHFNKMDLEVKRFEQIQEKWLYNCKSYIDLFNQHRAQCSVDGMPDLKAFFDMVKPYSLFENGKAKLDYNKVDQFICEESCKEHYSNINTLTATWENCNYEVEVLNFDLPSIKRYKKSKQEINKQVVELISEYESNPDKYDHQRALDTLNKLKDECLTVFLALPILGTEKIQELKYDDKAMNEELIKQHNRNAEAKLRLMIAESFKLGDRPTKKYVKETLQRLYDALGIKKQNGTRKIACASQLKDLKMYEIDESKNDKKEHIYIIKKILYQVKAAA
ncbi:hypothetical protein [Rubrolithibacter danxiaensis]|uniref:hypothetical protein n=1 Tax=Rubrolithibacter danxiaensis TaxID=3390805 RepID=UPI003BF8CF47